NPHEPSLTPELREELLESTRPVHSVTLLPRRLSRHLRSRGSIEGGQAWNHSQALLPHAENGSLQQLAGEDRRPISEGLARLLRHRRSNGHRPLGIRHLQFCQQRGGAVQTQFERWTHSSDNSPPRSNHWVGYFPIHSTSDSSPFDSARNGPRNSKCA